MSKYRTHRTIFYLTIVLALTTLSCQLGSLLGGEAQPVQQTLAPDFEAEPSQIETETIPTQMPETDREPAETEESPMETETASETQPPVETQPAIEMELCSSDNCVLDGTFLLEPPLGDPGRKSIDHSNRFGSYQPSTRNSHRGADFLNSTGIPVAAAADGTVVVAGDDLNSNYGPGNNVYGNLIIIEHNLPGIDEPVFTLYAHLSEISVEEDQEVSAGQEIGKVGMSGNVKGSTLHFEVRLGENSFDAARNPELWLKPMEDQRGQLFGVLAGRIMDSLGEYQRLDNIQVERLEGSEGVKPERVYLKTYGGKSIIGKEPWMENFATGGLPAGEYKISFMLGGYQSRVVVIKPGKLTHVTFQMP